LHIIYARSYFKLAVRLNILNVLMTIH
jgi:hypothetical protein